MQALSGQHWGTAFRSLLLCTAAATLATLITRLMIRSARSQSLLQPARWDFLAVYAAVGAVGFFAANACLAAPVEAGLWGGVFLVYTVDSLICRFAFPGNSE
jgi:hypothetical protein